MRYPYTSIWSLRVSSSSYRTMRKARFYSMARRLKREDKSEHKKPPYAQVRQRLADWVRSVGVDDEHVQPNHAWRHTFKQIADRFGISERMSDYITGHAHKSVGATYGAPTLEDMAEALKKFPRYGPAISES